MRSPACAEFTWFMKPAGDRLPKCEAPNDYAVSQAPYFCFMRAW